MPRRRPTGHADARSGPEGFRARVVVLFNRPGQCRWCRCTEREPCPGGCGWADGTATLCSACVPIDRASKSVRGRIALAELAQGCIDQGAFEQEWGDGVRE
jgi:hypothetical protein